MSVAHEELIVFDGLIVANWAPEVFADMRRGGVTAANCTCCVWEGFAGTMANVARWNAWFRAHGDLIVKARGTADIRAAKEEGRTAIVLGFQNTSAFEDRLGAVEIFKDAGVGIAQLAYNTQNLAGAGCYESRDSGLSDFGRELVAEQPVACTHCLPAGLKAHPRNKTDAQLRAVADRGGVIGVTMFPPFLPRGVDSTVDDYVAAIDYVVRLVGEDAVAIGTDFTQGHGADFFEWITRDKGHARKLTEFGTIENPEGLRTIGEFPNLTAAMGRAGWSGARIRKAMGENWLRLLAEVWHEGGPQT